MARDAFAQAWTGERAAQIRRKPASLSGATVEAGLLEGVAPMDRAREWHDERREWRR